MTERQKLHPKAFLYISTARNTPTKQTKTNKKGIAKLTLKKTKFKKGKNTVKISYLKDTIKTKVKIL